MNKIDIVNQNNENQPVNNNNVKQNCFKWEHIKYSIKTKTGQKQILNGISGKCKSGELTAILGPSGSGKSTFLDVLANRRNKENLEGDILLNGNKIKNTKYISSYIMQDEVLLGNLTVEENIRYAADLNIPQNTIKDKVMVKERIETFIQYFGLQKVRNSKIGGPLIRGVSGGERKRAYIATQCIGLQPILFLDEPTSGLDSAASFHVVNSLKKLAQKYNLIVLVTIHQPSPKAVNLFDRVLLLGTGEEIYTGSIDDMIVYFDHIGHTIPIHVNPTDHVLDLINIDFSENYENSKQIIEDFKLKWVDYNVQQVQDDNDQQDNTSELNVSNNTVSFFTQTFILIKRTFLNAYRNPILYWVRLLMYIALSILMATTWVNLKEQSNEVQDRLSLLFFLVAFTCFMSVAVIPAYLEDRLLYIREYNNGSYMAISYVIANTIIQIIFIALITFFITIIVYPSVNLNPDAERAVIFAILLFILLLVAESITLLISALVPIFVAALAIVSFLNGFFMIVQGYFIRYSNLPSFWIWGHYWAYHKYGFEAMVINDVENLQFTCDSLPNSCQCLFARLDTSKCVLQGEDILNEFDYEDINVGLWIGILVIQYFVYRLLFYLILSRSYKYDQIIYQNFIQSLQLKMKKISMVFGGAGALGDSIVQKLSRGFKTISVDIKSNKNAQHSIELNPNKQLVEQYNDIKKSLQKIDIKKVDNIICVNGGFDMVDIQSSNLFSSMNDMINKNFYPSLIAAHMLNEHMNDNGILLLTGAEYIYNNPAPEMITYALSKNMIHNLHLNLQQSKMVQEKNLNVLTILPTVLDTPVNREAMADMDKSEWIPLEKLSDLIYMWNTSDNRPQNGSLVQLKYKKGSIQTDVKNQLFIQKTFLFQHNFNFFFFIICNHTFKICHHIFYLFLILYCYIILYHLTFFIFIFFMSQQIQISSFSFQQFQTIFHYF